eukprot:1890046-Pyramimonas_sp.AAC.2
MARRGRSGPRRNEGAYPYRKTDICQRFRCLFFGCSRGRHRSGQTSEENSAWFSRDSKILVTETIVPDSFYFEIWLAIPTPEKINEKIS